MAQAKHPSEFTAYGRIRHDALDFVRRRGSEKALDKYLLRMYMKAKLHHAKLHHLFVRLLERALH
jgi:hypothetical protein